ncbi:hypothetical protein H0W91_03740 [Patescibacteria group bacterium]|nr:hypothetical protein [Patescibacteria group bacterium]
MDQDESSIERLKRTLYSRNENVVPKEKRTPVQPHETTIQKDWGAPPTFGLTPDVMAKPNNSFFNKFLVGSLIFFFASLGIALFIFFGGLNLISSNNLDINITAPSSVSSGEELAIGLSVVNGNRTDLEEVSLFIDYPDGSQSVVDNSKTLSHEKIDLGVIPRGGIKDYTLRTLLFGEKDAVKVFNLRLEYRVKGSNAVFSKEKPYSVIIGSSPILLNVSYPKEINSGQEVSLSIDVTSNSSVVLKNVIVKVEYPYGFTYKSSSLTPLRDNAIWNIGDLKGGDKKNLTVTGVLVGQNMEDRSFKITSGTPGSSASQNLDTPLAASLVTIGIRKSFFDLSVGVEGEASGGRSMPVSIKWQNTLPDKITNNHIEAVISGNVFDRSQVAVSNGGFYRSTDNTVIWDKNSTPVLESILPGDNGQVNLSVSSFQNSAQTRAIKNPHIDLHVTMTGERLGSLAGEISSSQDITIKIDSSLAISGKAVSNSGPIPPKADKETIYTITWVLTNTTNDLKDTTVTASLPSGVVWKGEASPVGENISINPDTKLVTWNIGNVSAGAGFTSSPKTVSFKVGITPSINQISSPAPLISAINAVASDTYTENRIGSSADSISTDIVVK